LLPALNGALDEAPATLNRVPLSLGTDAQTLVPELRNRLQDINPMVDYLAPYGRDLGAFIANFHAGFAYKGADGRSVLRLSPFVNAQTLKADPVSGLTTGILLGSNGYPAPGAQSNPQQFSGAYPRLYQEPK
jgi:phospholipid/cholesterol/gamma-HCH transport system substrate-binding protein